MSRKKRSRFGVIVAVVCFGALLCPGPALHAQQAPVPTLDPDGTIHSVQIPAPPSPYLSPEGKAAFVEVLQQSQARAAALRNQTIAGLRQETEDRAKAALDRWLAIYPATIEDTTIDGVHVFIITPKGGVDPKNKNRVLIGAHQGGFSMGGKYSAQVEAVPMAGRGRIKVIAVDYRLAPEFTFPAASEDMEAVYRHVLKTTKPANVGLFGCSAGGSLVAESVAWFQKKGLPRPGAVEIMCSGAMKDLWSGGDGNITAPLLTALPPRSSTYSAAPAAVKRRYFDGVDASDPLVAPGEHPDVLAKFPPSLLVTGTRDSAMSNAIMTHTALLKAGVHAELFVQEGLGHGHFYLLAGTPEALAAYDVFWNFFDANLRR